MTIRINGSADVPAKAVSTIVGVVVFFFMLPVFFILRGFVIQYGWNNLLAQPLDLPTIGILTGIALAVLVGTMTKITNYAEKEKRGIWESMAIMLTTNGLTLLFFWILTWFK